MADGLRALRLWLLAALFGAPGLVRAESPTPVFQKGVTFGGWSRDAYAGPAVPAHTSFTPQGKPAGSVLREYYSRSDR